jgi:hypothetical protein
MNFDRLREITLIFPASLSENASLSRLPIIMREQEVYRPAKDSVAFARNAFKFFGIEKSDPAPRLADRTFHL